MLTILGTILVVLHSLAGLAISTLRQYVLSTPPADMTSGLMIGMNVAIWAVCIGLLYYAMRMRKAGVLRQLRIVAR